MRKTIIVGHLFFVLVAIAILPMVSFAQTSQFGTSETSQTDANGITTNSNSVAPATGGAASQGGAGVPAGGGGGVPAGGGGGVPAGGGGGNPSPVPQTSMMNLGLPNPLGGNVNSLSDLVFKVVQMVVDVSYVVVAFFIILSGFKFVTAQGSDSKLEDAKKTFFYTIIGAVLVIGAQVIASVVQNIFNTLK